MPNGSEKWASVLKGGLRFPKLLFPASGVYRNCPSDLLLRETHRRCEFHAHFPPGVCPLLLFAIGNYHCLAGGVFLLHAFEVKGG